MFKFWWINNTNQKMLVTSPKKCMFANFYSSFKVRNLYIQFNFSTPCGKKHNEVFRYSFLHRFFKKKVKRTKFEVKDLFPDPHHLQFHECGNVLTIDSNNLFTKPTFCWKHIGCRILIHTHMVICVTQLYKTFGLKMSLNGLVVAFFCRLRFFIFYSVILRPPEIETCYVH